MDEESRFQGMHLRIECMIEVAPTHQLIDDLLIPLLYTVQSRMEKAASPIKFLYTEDIQTNRTIHVNTTSWMVYASKSVYWVLNFLSVDTAMQTRLKKRVETTKQKMRKWLWNEEGYFNDIRKEGHEFVHSKQCCFDSVYPFVLDVGSINTIKTDDYLHLLFDSAHVFFQSSGDV